MERLTLALIAHDTRKEDMVSLIKAHREELSEINLVATKKTGEMIQFRIGLPVMLLESGLHGGDQQIGALVANGDVSAVIFLRDPIMAQPHEPKIADLLLVCDMHAIPLATNMAAGEAVIHLLLDHPEALSGHHIAAQYLEEMAAVRE